MNKPSLIGRFGDNETDSRATTELLCDVSVPLVINGEGEVRISIFKSTDSGVRGGFVLRIIMDKQDSGFQPFAVNLDDGVEVHIAGEIEARQATTALKAAVSAL